MDEVEDVFYEAQVELAFRRYEQVTGKTWPDFIHWNGHLLSLTDEIYDGLGRIRVGRGSGNHMVRKLEMLLGPHWYALLKAELAREDACQK